MMHRLLIPVTLVAQFAGGALAQAPAPTPPTSAEVAALLEQVDRCFGKRDLEGFLDCFRPVHAERHVLFANRIEQVFSYGVALTRATKVEREWTLGAHRVSLVRAETRSVAQPERDPMVEHALLAVRKIDDAPRATAWIEVDADFLGMIPDSASGALPRHLLNCHACNYRIDAGNDWLMVPNLKDRIGCFESLSFYSLDTDLVADLTVHMARELEAPASKRWLRDIAVQQCELSAPEALDLETWIPPAYGPGMPAPARLDGARCEIPLEIPGQGATVYLAVYGRLGYLISVHGRKAAIAQNRMAIDDLLSSFTLIEPNLDPEQLEVRILEERLGSTLDEGAFRNVKFEVAFPGIDGWDTRLDAGPYAFDATWRCPRQSGRFRLRGLTPPRGFSRWTPQAADMVLAPMLKDLGLFKARKAADWRRATEEDADFRWRLDLERHDGSRNGAQHHAVLIRLADDLLVVADAESDDAGELSSLQGAALDLTRRR